jgi:hypothetical protein
LYLWISGAIRVRSEPFKEAPSYLENRIFKDEVEDESLWNPGITASLAVFPVWCEVAGIGPVLGTKLGESPPERDKLAGTKGIIIAGTMCMIETLPRFPGFARCRHGFIPA